MFVGEYFQVCISRKHSNSRAIGAAIGSLGRHTQIASSGVPIFDSRMEVFFKVDSDSVTIACLTALIRESDFLHFTTDADRDIWIYEACCGPFLSKVSHFYGLIWSSW